MKKIRPFGLLGDVAYADEDPRSALEMGGGGAVGQTPNADALGQLLYGLTNVGGMQDAAGLLGGPSLRENLAQGNKFDAAMQGVGMIPVVGGGAKMAMALAPRSIKGLDAMLAAQKAAKVAEKAAPAVSEAPAAVANAAPLSRAEKAQAKYEARLRQPGEVGGLLNEPHVPILPGDARISTRQPRSIMYSNEDPFTEHLSIGMREFLADPNAEHNAAILSRYPGLAHLAGMSPADAAEAYVQHAHDNMNYLYSKTPEIMRQRSPVWYDGAHEFVDDLSRRWGVQRRNVSAGTAALSPQKDWFQNGSLIERIGDVVFGPNADRKMTPEMFAYAMRPGTKAEPNFIAGDPDLQELFRSIAGKSFSQIDDPTGRAMWMRVFDEAHNPKAYRAITPEGLLSDFVRTGSGKTRNIGWGSLNEISKGIEGLLGGGTNEEIQRLLGGTHKVPSFYNNIEVPNDIRFGGDVTADTHQVAAALLRALSGKSMAVSHNFGPGLAKKDQPADWIPAKTSAITGVNGTYGLNAEATRRFAADHGLVPRAGQSLGWEPVRELFTDAFKRNPENVKMIDDIWRMKDAGQISAAEARDRIFNAAGGIGQPQWAIPGVEAFPVSRGSTYR